MPGSGERKMATSTPDDMSAMAQRCLDEWERSKPRLQRPKSMTDAVFASSIRALVVGYCKDSTAPSSGLEDIVMNENLRGMIVGARGSTQPQSLLEAGLRLLDDVNIAKS